MNARERLAALPPDARTAVLSLLDEISRPLDVRDVDLALAKANIPRSQRRPMIRALLQAFDVIALEPRQ